MKTNELLSLDFTKKENKNKMQKALRKIDYLSHIPEFKDISIITLENYISKVEKKYSIMLYYICPVFTLKEHKLSATIINTETGELLETFFSENIYDLFCKVCIYYYYQIKVKKIKLKNWDDVNKPLLKEVWKCM